LIDARKALITGALGAATRAVGSNGRKQAGTGLEQLSPRLIHTRSGSFHVGILRHGLLDQR